MTDEHHHQQHEQTGKARKLRTERSDQQEVVRLLCVDDHPMLLEGLRAQFGLDHRIVVVGTLGGATDIESHIQTSRPDVVLLDIDLPDTDSFEVARSIIERFDRLRVAFLSAHTRQGYLSSAYHCGSSGYFCKGDDLESLVEGVITIARSPANTFIMGPKVKQRCLSGSTGRVAPEAARLQPVTQVEHKPPFPSDSLTTREVEVLRLIGRGLSRNEIANELSRSPKTIDGHQEHILEKLGLENRAELIRYAIREGFVEP